MTVATLLLDLHDKYVEGSGQLPVGRPNWDKGLLAGLIDMNVISPAAAKMLPPSMCSGMIDEEFTMPITIQEVNDTADMIIIVRAYSICPGGKKFRLDDYKQLVKSGRLEIWIRKD
jgi:hypothetical protein